MYFVNIIITQLLLQSELENEKGNLCCCFTWIVLTELNFTVAFLLIRKTWDDKFAGKVWGWWILRNGEILVMGRVILKWGGVDTPLWTMYM